MLACACDSSPCEGSARYTASPLWFKKMATVLLVTTSNISTLASIRAMDAATIHADRELPSSCRIVALITITHLGNFSSGMAGEMADDSCYERSASFVMVSEFSFPEDTVDSKGTTA